MKTKLKSETKVEDWKSSMAVGLAMITLSIFLIITKNLFYCENTTRILAYLLCGLGIAYTSIGTKKITNARTDYIGVGSVFLAVCGIISLFINNTFVNSLVLIGMFFGAGGVYLGLIDVVEKLSKVEKISDKLKNFVAFLTSVASLVFLIFQIIFYNKI